MNLWLIVRISKMTDQHDQVAAKNYRLELSGID